MSTRRRGAELEADLLDAAWEELASAGYAALTFEAVAARARTSRMVLYRRWPNRASLVMAAARRRVTPLAADVPDTGSLRDDVLTVLRRQAGRYGEFGADVIHGLLAERADLPPDVLAGIPELMGTLLSRAAERGEIEAALWTSGLLALPADLVRHDVLLARRAVPEERLAEIVDEIFLPLLRAVNR